MCRIFQVPAWFMFHGPQSVLCFPVPCGEDSRNQTDQCGLKILDLFFLNIFSSLCWFDHLKCSDVISPPTLNWNVSLPFLQLSNKKNSIKKKKWTIQLVKTKHKQHWKVIFSFPTKTHTNAAATVTCGTSTSLFLISWSTWWVAIWEHDRWSHGGWKPTGWFVNKSTFFSQYSSAGAGPKGRRGGTCPQKHDSSKSLKVGGTCTGFSPMTEF